MIKYSKEISLSEISSILEEKSKLTSNKKEKLHYVNNAELHEEFLKYHYKKLKWWEDGKEGVPPYGDIIGKAILQIANNALYAPRFIAYTDHWKSEMKDNAIDHCVRYAHNYDPFLNDKKPIEDRKKPNPFSYLTQFCRNAYFQIIKKESAEKYWQYKLLIEGGLSSFESEISGDVDERYLREVYEYIDHYEKVISDLAEIKRKKQLKKELEDSVKIN